MNFADRLKQLPSAAHLTSLQVLDAGGQVVATLENKPGQAGSLALYAALAALYGGHITPCHLYTCPSPRNKKANRN